MLWSNLLCKARELIHSPFAIVWPSWPLLHPWPSFSLVPTIPCSAFCLHLLALLLLPNSLHWRPRDLVFGPFSCLSMLIPGDVISSCDSNYHLYVVNSQILYLGPELSPKPLSHATNCSHDFSTWISNTKLKLNMFKQELPSHPTQISVTSSFWIDEELMAAPSSWLRKKRFSSSFSSASYPVTVSSSQLTCENIKEPVPSSEPWRWYKGQPKVIMTC